MFGGTVNAASGPVELAADERCGGTLLMEPGAAASTVPLAASGPAAVLTLTRAAGGASAGPPSTPAGDSTAGAAAAARARHVLGFQVWLASDPAAPAPPPPLPPLWQQAAGEITASIQQQQQQQQGGVCIPGIISPVIAVCGPKKVGKSTFARLLVNSLLSCHPCVTYLDTGGVLEAETGKRGRQQHQMHTLIAQQVFGHWGLRMPGEGWPRICAASAQPAPARSAHCCRLRPARVHCPRPGVPQPRVVAGRGPAAPAPAPPGGCSLCGGRVARPRPCAVPAVRAGAAQLALPARRGGSGGGSTGRRTSAMQGCQLAGRPGTAAAGAAAGAGRWQDAAAPGGQHPRLG